MSFSAATRILTVLVPGLFLVACADKITLENYGKLQIGQTFDDVQKIVGAPARCDEVLGIRSCTWGDEQHGFKVNFVGGQVILMSARDLK